MLSVVVFLAIVSMCSPYQTMICTADNEKAVHTIKKAALYSEVYFLERAIQHNRWCYLSIKIRCFELDALNETNSAFILHTI